MNAWWQPLSALLTHFCIFLREKYRTLLLPMDCNTISRIPVILLAISLSHQAQAQADQPSTVPLYDNLGTHHYAITTADPKAQQYFDQGFRLYYAFNHTEAIRAFNEAARLDPECAMCYWGTALSYGPNINLPMDKASGIAAYLAITQALTVAEHSTDKEQALIKALAKRYAKDPPQDRKALDMAYSKALKKIVSQYPQDLEARTLYAESLMDLNPWQYWNANGSPRRNTPELLKHLELVMQESPDHPGANHFYIHAVEAVQPERAVSAAERLANLMPGAGHLVHMPGHIYIRVGRYMDAIKANEHAVHADESYIADQNPTMGIYVAGYYPHNYDFMAFAASMIGRSEQAISAAEKIAALAPQELLREPGMTFLQHHKTKHLQMKVRFSHWDEILKEAAPAEDLIHARAMWHYAQGRAMAAKGNIAGAEAHWSQVLNAAQDPSIKDEKMEFNTAGAVLTIASEVLAGQIASAKKDYPQAIRHLRKAVLLEDRLVYGEPPEWSVPVRQEFGKFLLKVGLAADAEKVFREDLNRFPENGWSLYGLAQALDAQNRTKEAKEVIKRFNKIWSTADIKLTDAR